MQTLRDILQGIENANPDATVAVPLNESITLDTCVLLIEELNEADNPIIPDGYRELMDVWHIQDVTKDLSKLLASQNARTPTNSEILDRFMVFLATDA